MAHGIEKGAEKWLAIHFRACLLCLINLIGVPFTPFYCFVRIPFKFHCCCNYERRSIEMQAIDMNMNHSDYDESPQFLSSQQNRLFKQISWGMWRLDRTKPIDVCVCDKHRSI